VKNINGKQFKKQKKKQILFGPFGPCDLYP